MQFLKKAINLSLVQRPGFQLFVRPASGFSVLCVRVRVRPAFRQYLTMRCIALANIPNVQAFSTVSCCLVWLAPNK